MSRLTLPLAILIAAGVALPGCAKNKQLPSQLAPSRMTSIGVNAYLWRAAVDTLSFAPLITADSNGGVIVTDWYANPTTPGERVKLTVAIIDQDLRADALRVAASRQVNQGGVWVDAPVAAATVQKLEDIILTRARDLRRTSVGG
jgi:alpha-beta hydrolase superfamily lysophospholipase